MPSSLLDTHMKNVEKALKEGKADAVAAALSQSGTFDCSIYL